MMRSVTPKPLYCEGCLKVVCYHWISVNPVVFCEECFEEKFPVYGPEKPYIEAEATNIERMIHDIYEPHIKKQLMNPVLIMERLYNGGV